MVGNHTEQVELPGNPAKLQAAPLCQLCHINAVGGHTADSFFRMGAGQIFFPLTGIAQWAAIVPSAEAGASRRFYFCHQTQDSRVVGFLGMADSAFIIEALDVPDGGDHQCFFLIENCLVQRFHTAAVRRAGVIGTILAAEILLTKFPELGVIQYYFDS